MLYNTFQFLHGIGPALEHHCWTHDITDWNDYLTHTSIPYITPGQKLHHDTRIQHARRAVTQDTTYFTTWPHKLRWRLYTAFKHNAAYLDIETDTYGDVTIVGINTDTTHHYIQQRNIDRDVIETHLQRADILITYNGTRFDLPVLQRQLNITCDTPHLDLCAFATTLHDATGLTALEHHYDIPRTTDVNPVRYWHRYRRTGNDDILHELLTYNEEDVTNLQPLAHALVEDKRQPLPVTTRPTRHANARQDSHRETRGPPLRPR